MSSRYPIPGSTADLQSTLRKLQRAAAKPAQVERKRKWEEVKANVDTEIKPAKKVAVDADKTGTGTLLSQLIKEISYTKQTLGEDRVVQQQQVTPPKSPSPAAQQTDARREGEDKYGYEYESRAAPAPAPQSRALYDQYIPSYSSSSHDYDYDYTHTYYTSQNLPAPYDPHTSLLSRTTYPSGFRHYTTPAHSPIHASIEVPDVSLANAIFGADNPARISPVNPLARVYAKELERADRESRHGPTSRSERPLCPHRNLRFIYPFTASRFYKPSAVESSAFLHSSQLSISGVRGANKDECNKKCGTDEEVMRAAEGEAVCEELKRQAVREMGECDGMRTSAGRLRREVGGLKLFLGGKVLA